MTSPERANYSLTESALSPFPAEPAQYDIFTIGAGYSDIRAAIQSQDANSGLAKSLTAVFDPAAGTVWVQFDSSGILGTSPSWSSSVALGDTVFRNLSSVVWGASLVWGDTTSAERRRLVSRLGDFLIYTGPG